MGPGETAEATDNDDNESDSVRDFEESLNDALEADVAEKTRGADSDDD